MDWRAHNAIAVAREIAAGERGRGGAVRATLEGIAARDQAVGAFAATLPLAQAEAALDAASGPLLGIPVGVKDIFDTADLPTGYGTSVYPAKPSRSDAAMIGVLRKAGAVVVGKTVSTEFAFLHPAATRNPNAPGHTPGGSSAGSAAGVAAGLIPLAVGTQTGGSVIRPASYCGVVGFKPSFALLPTAGAQRFSWSLDTVGLFANTVAEAAWFAQATTGHALALANEPARSWRFAVLESHPWGEADAECTQAVAHAVNALRGAGADVQRMAPPGSLADAFHAHDAIQGYEASRSLAREFALYEDALSPVLRAYLTSAQAVTADGYARAQHTAATARTAGNDWLARFDAVITPAAPGAAPVGFGSTGASTFNRAWTLLHAPCITVPGQRSVDGLPVGVQLVSARGQDAGNLRAAAFLEAALAAGRPLSGAVA